MNEFRCQIYETSDTFEINYIYENVYEKYARVRFYKNNGIMASYTPTRTSQSYYCLVKKIVENYYLDLELESIYNIQVVEWQYCETWSNL